MAARGAREDWITRNTNFVAQHLQITVMLHYHLHHLVHMWESEDKKQDVRNTGAFECVCLRLMMRLMLVGVQWGFMGASTSS